MTQTSPLDIATAFTRAWTGHDLEKAASYVAEDVVFDGPCSNRPARPPT
ncbi:nuclear transport factor 2 family protein [Mesorhizobium sp. M0510]